MSGILRRSEEGLGSQDEWRIRLGLNTCERNINDTKGKEEGEEGVFTPEVRIKSRPGNGKETGSECRNARKDMAWKIKQSITLFTLPAPVAQIHSFWSYLSQKSLKEKRKKTAHIP